MKALGLIETRGMVGAIVAADIALKTAQVELINKEYTKNIITMMERNHDWPLISSKKTNPSHMLWFPSYLRGIPYRYGYIR